LSCNMFHMLGKDFNESDAISCPSNH
jgi:hypothetical protein